MRHGTAIASRVVAAVVGGYAATVGLVALASVLLALAGMQRSEAVVLMTIIGFIGYVAILIWGFAEPRLLRLWAVLGGVAVASHLGALWLAERLPAPVSGG
jgi:hypothetical protein